MRDVRPIFSPPTIPYAQPEGPPDLRYLRPTANMSAVMVLLNLLFWSCVVCGGSILRPYDPDGLFSFSIIIVGFASLGLTVLLLIATILLYRSHPAAVRLNRIYAWLQTIVCIISFPLFVSMSRTISFTFAIPGVLGVIYPLSLFASFRDE